jgi:1-acyl-sn-glycerol-3-phosphate acyltransferase
MSALTIVRAVLSTGIYSGATVWDSLRGRLTLARGDEIIRTWSKQLLEQVDITLKVRGVEQLDTSKTYVVMSNHQSLYDIPVLITALPLCLRMVAKAELFKVPLWAQAMKAAGFVPVHRGQRDKALQDLRAAQEALSRGISIWIAPEGTRSPDGQLLAFKSGGFMLAGAAKVPVLPVTIDGTRKILPARALQFVRGVEVNVTIGEPVDASRYSRKERPRFVEEVRGRIMAGFQYNQ